ncbi:MAG: hypothetical protein GF411_13670 [Candidatus Lokiarchaeota archaeon]|nr:hypothetical protein [Candidatus Lokiarchaeota archaeon]
MSRKDLFARYSQIYTKGKTREIIPEGAFVRQLSDLPTTGMDFGLFFNPKRGKEVQVYIGNPLPEVIGEEEGFFEGEDNTYLSRTLLEDFKAMKYIRAGFAAGKLLTTTSERIEFLKKCQRAIDVLARKARNVIHMDDFEPFRYDRCVKTLDDYLRKKLKFDDVATEAGKIPFIVASPEYVILDNDDIIVMDDQPIVEHGVFHFVGGIGYSFDKKVGAVNEERLFRVNKDLSDAGINQAYVDSMISRVTEDFQTQIHSIIFTEIWKKSKAKPVGVNVDGRLLIKTAESSDMWSGVFEVYVAEP